MLLYVHIPFCRQKCRYCSFVSFPGQEAQAEAYVRLLLKEAENRIREFTGPVHTVFIGGGTPSLLPPDLLSLLASSLFSSLPSVAVQEFTVEANPGTVTRSWIEAARNAGVNRLSLGMQAFQPELLTLLGRIHSYSDVEETVRLSREYGFTNLNLDLMFGIPGQSLASWKETLEAALALEPVHISAYGLIPEENTPLYRDLESGRLSLPDPDLEREMYDLALSMLSARGLRQYEVSNFALPGYECRHNIGYWKQVPYVGLGISAASMQILQSGASGMVCRRKTNPSGFSAYENMVIGKGGPAEDVTVSPAEARFETLMLGLRMNEGVRESDFERLHGVSLGQVYGEKLKSLEAGGLLVCEDHCWKLTRRGFDIQNAILVELMEDA